MKGDFSEPLAFPQGSWQCVNRLQAITALRRCQRRGGCVCVSVQLVSTDVCIIDSCVCDGNEEQNGCVWDSAAGNGAF